MKKFIVLTVMLVAMSTRIFGDDTSGPLRIGIIGLVHGHVSGFLNGGALVPAGGALHRPDVQIVGVVEPDDQLFSKYATRYHWPDAMHFQTIEELAATAHPQAALIFTSTAGHTEAVEKCARLGIHAMMEKPMAVSSRDAIAMADAARAGHIHVLVDYETSWYPSNKAAYELLKQNALGPITKVVARDGHSGPAKIHVQPEFFRWLTNPVENGAGALYDFGCYGADLMTWLMNGEAPLSVSAITKHLQPTVYPNVDDEADVLVNYKNAVAILQGSWTWPFNVKDMDVYGMTGYAKTIGSAQLNVRLEHEKQEHTSTATPIAPPYDDPLHLLRAVIRGEVDEDTGLSSLKVNVIVSEILDAARRSAQTGQTIKLSPQP
ncbi:MAG: Gfo/Idh/MocA family protein [Bryobacteraceae bacterium]